MTPAVHTNDCRSYVQQLVPFRNHSRSLWAERRLNAVGDDFAYMVRSRKSTLPLFGCWRGVWFSRGNTILNSHDLARHMSLADPLVPTVPAYVHELDLMWWRGKPCSDMLIRAHEYGLLPEELIPVAVAARIGAWS